jgi:ketosteroid isomerase-like protein
MNPSLQDLVTRTFVGVEAKDLNLMMGLFADDAVLIDPHFPVPRLQGKAAIAEGLRGAFAGMQSFGYTLEKYFESESGESAAVETATHHIIKKGIKLNFPQVFIFDALNGRVTRMQAYEPYGPHGIMGMFLSMGRVMKRLSGKCHQIRRKVARL